MEIFEQNQRSPYHPISNRTYWGKGYPGFRSGIGGSRGYPRFGKGLDGGSIFPGLDSGVGGGSGYPHLGEGRGGASQEDINRVRSHCRAPMI